MKVICLDCSNEIALEEGRIYQVGDVIECPICGCEMEVVEAKDTGEVVLRLIEEEK